MQFRLLKFFFFRASDYMSYSFELFLKAIGNRYLQKTKKEKKKLLPKYLKEIVEEIEKIL